MKSIRLTTDLLIWLALISNGCAWLSPSAANYPTWQQEKQEQIGKAGVPENCAGWELLWMVFYLGGEMLASK